MSEPRPFSLDVLGDDGNHPYLPASDEPKVELLQSFPEVIDNTAREQFFNCPQKFYRSTINKLAPKWVSEHLHFGGAFATGLEHMRKAFYDKGLPQDKALAIGIVAATKFYGTFEPSERSFKTFENLVLGIEWYSNRYPLATDCMQPYQLTPEKHAIEFTFAIPLPINHPETGNPLIYAGRFDMLCKYLDALFVYDDKTTSKLGPTWKNQWQLNSQITGYCWAAQQHNIPVAGAILRGQSILKSSFDTEQVITYRSQTLIDRWYKQLLRDIERMLEAYHSGYYDYALGHACAAYSGCEFLKLCSSQNPDAWIQSEYRQRFWNPLHKNPEEPIEVHLL
jgi:hypothetical protein